MDKVFLNDKIVSADQVSLGIADSSYLYGIGLFETLRAAGGRVFRLDDHLNRMIASAKALKIPFGYRPDEIADAVGQTLQANGLSEARMRMTLSTQPAQAACGKGTLLITAAPLVSYPKDYYDKGMRVILSDFRQHSKDPLCGHKTTSYVGRLTALKIAHEKLAGEALWFTADNKLAEGCISNVFLVRDGVLYTPRPETPILSGIARKTILELAAQLNIDTVEQDLTVHDLLAAQEVFLTNVIMTALPVTAIESHTVGDGKVGAMTRKLIEGYERLLK